LSDKATVNISTGNSNICIGLSYYKNMSKNLLLQVGIRVEILKHRTEIIFLTRDFKTASFELKAYQPMAEKILIIN
jgi:hypothetical protein